MLAWSRLTRSRHNPEVPAEIYISVVNSLYEDSRTFFIGALAVSLVIFMTAWKTEEPLLYLCTVAFMLIAFARAIGIRAYLRERPNVKTARVSGYVGVSLRLRHVGTRRTARLVVHHRIREDR